MTDQTELRQTILAQRCTLSPNLIQQHARCLLNHLIELNLFRPKSKLGLYLAQNGEMDLTPAIEYACKNHVECYLPIVQHNSTLLFAPYLPTSKMKPNAFNIPEPVFESQAMIPAQALDVMLIPLVVFDHRGNRIGMGKGYYDRTLSGQCKTGLDPSLIGCAHALQQVDAIEPNEWDVALDAIVTENGIISPNHQ